jgi:uncharacterized protein YndB with AHSA1/START domain
MGDTEFIIEPGRQDLVVRRTFDAPKDVVFRALTDRALIPNWWGPRRYRTEVDVMDVRPGGRWRFLNIDADGTEYGFHGVYHDVVAPERIVQTFEFEGTPGHVQLESATLEGAGGTTTLTALSIFQSVEDRDAMVQHGMVEGASETYDRLTEVIAGLLSPVR